MVGKLESEKKVMLKRILILVTILLLGCSSDGTDGVSSVGQNLETISLPMGYIPDPQYAPFYVATEKGYFAEAGFEVEFDYSFETDGMALVGAGARPFALVSGEQVVLARAQGVPVVYVMEWFQRFPIAIVSRSAENITTPADLAGKQVGVPGPFGASYVGLIGLLSANGLSEADITREDINFTQFEQILNDQVQSAVVYANNEPVRLAGEGIDINVIQVSDYIDMVANGIITNEAMIAENPEKVEAFVHAVLRGLADTLADPDAAYETTKQYIEGLDDSRKAVLEASLPLWEAQTLGMTEPTSWTTTQEILIAAGQLDAEVERLEAAYTNQFIESFE